MLDVLLCFMLGVAADPVAKSASAPLPTQAAGPGENLAPHGGYGGRRTLFVSPMGEPFRGQASRSAGLDAWFAQVDKDGDHFLSIQEVRDDAARFFATLDVGHDQEIDPDDVHHYENDIAPEIQMGVSFGRDDWPKVRGDGGQQGNGNRGGSGDQMGGDDSGRTKHVRNAPDDGLKGAGRLGLLNIPEPVMAADADLNRGITAAEFQKAATARFVLLDTNGDGKLSLDELQTRMAALPTGRSGGHPGRPR
jgi:hypothetical protein